MPFDKPRIFSPGEHGEATRETHEHAALPPQSAARSGAVMPGLRGEDASPTDDDLGLPAELQMLAAELRGEADMFAERYAPAATPSQFDERHSMRRWIWRGVAVSLAGIALLTWQIERSLESPRPTAIAQANELSSRASADAIRAAAIRADAIRADAIRTDAIRTDAIRTDAIRADAIRADAIRADAIRADAIRADAIRADAIRADAIRAVSQAVPPSPDAAAIRRTQGIAEVGMNQPAADRHPPADQVEMLRMQLSGFEKVIQRLQLEVKARDAAQIESQHQIELLQTEVATLRKQLDEKRNNAERR